MKLETKADVAAVTYCVLGAISDSKSTCLQGIPNGHLYALLMNEFDIDQWTKIIDALKASQLITDTNHLLQMTPKGEKMFMQLEEIYKANKAKGDHKT